MATLTVWKFPDSDGADRVLHKIEALQKQDLIQVHDAAIVTWVQGKKKPKARQVFSTTGAGAAGGAFWGLLFGLLFFVPFFGMALGAAAGALAGSLTDFGINDDFIKSVREKVTEGTSALFLMSSGEVVDRVQPALAGEDMTLITTNLSVVDEAALKEMFSE